MALIVLPFFMPLLLLGWVLTPREERDLRRHERRRDREFAETWGQLFAREDEPPPRVGRARPSSVANGPGCSSEEFFVKM